MSSVANVEKRTPKSIKKNVTYPFIEGKAIVLNVVKSNARLQNIFAISAMERTFWLLIIGLVYKQCCSVVDWAHCLDCWLLFGLLFSVQNLIFSGWLLIKVLL